MTTKKKWLIAVLAVLLAGALGVLGWHLYDNNVDRSGWRELDGAYFYQDFHADRVTGWQDLEGKRYYFGEDGILQTHWQLIDGNRYYFGRDGALDTGWLEVEGHCYRTDGSGVILTGWQEVEGSRYYLDENGILQTSWQMVPWLPSGGILTEPGITLVRMVSWSPANWSCRRVSASWMKRAGL